MKKKELFGSAGQEKREAPTDLERCNAHVIERGFDRVTVAEVARAANVSVNTIFNYFATKEDLFSTAAKRWKTNQAASFANGCGAVRRRCESSAHFRQAVSGKTTLPSSAAAKVSIGSCGRSTRARHWRARQLLMVEESERRLASTLAREPAPSPTTDRRAVVAAMILGIIWMLFWNSAHASCAANRTEAAKRDETARPARLSPCLRAGTRDYAVRKK